MTTRTLGKNGPAVPLVNYGAMGLSAFYSLSGDEATKAKQGYIELLQKCVKEGRMIDTADIYNDNEVLIGEALKGIPREKFFLASKFSFFFENGQMKVRGDPEYIKKACDTSLKRLQMPYIDLYYQHRVDPNTPIEDTMGALKELVEQGKIKHIGLSECSGDTLRRAYKVHPVTAVQIEYSLWTRDIETNGLLDACKDLGVAIVAYSPLGRGLLANKFKSPDEIPEGDFRKTNPRFLPGAFEKNMDLVKEVEKVASKIGATPGQVALAWILEQYEYAVVIPGTKSMKYFEENNGAEKIKLTKEQLAEITDISNKANVTGERYSEAMMGMVNL